MCDFCNELDEWLEIKQNKVNKQIKDEYKCCLVIESYKNGYFKGKITSKAYKLNYCPMCGRNLSEDNEADDGK